MKNICSIHSKFTIYDPEPFYVLTFYKRPETVLVLHWVQCCRELSDDSSAEEIINKVKTDSIFSLLSESCQDFLGKLMIEYFCSFDGFDDLAAALFLIKELQSLLMLKVRNELMALSNNTFGQASINVTELEKESYVSVRNITEYCYENISDNKVITTESYLRYLTLPGASKEISENLTKRCLKHCYCSNVTEVQNIYDFIVVFAYLHGLDEEELKAAVISYLVKIAIRCSVALNKVQLFKDKFKLLIQEGGVQI